MGEEKKKSGLVSTILTLVVVLGIAGAFGYKFLVAPPSDPIKREQLTPEGALKVYLKTGYDFLHDQATMYDMQKCITKEDYIWFQDNYNNLHEDTFNLSTGIDPTEADAVARISVMRRLIVGGIGVPDCTISDVNISGGQADLGVGYTVEGYDYSGLKVQLVKEGRYWKVKDFAGGRASVEGIKRPRGSIVMKKTGTPTGSPPTADGAGTQPNGMMGVPPGGVTGAPPGAMPPQPALPPGAPPGAPAWPSPSNNAPPAANPATGWPAPPPGGPGGTAATVEEADGLIQQARDDWSSGRFQDSVAKAEKALAIYRQRLGDADPKTKQVEAMLAAARSQANSAQ